MRFLRYLSLSLLLSTAPVFVMAQDQSAVRQTPTGYTIDFDNQELRVVISALAEAAGLSVTFSSLPDVRTTLHLRNAQPDQLVDEIRAIAEANGLVMIRRGQIIRITSARPEATPTEAASEEVELFTYRLKHASVAQVAPLLLNLFSGTYVGGQAQGQGQGQGQAQGAGSADHVRIIPEESTNTLLIRATPDEWEWIQYILQSIDTRPLQVLIEAVIVEVTRSKDLNVGVAATATYTKSGHVDPTAKADLPSVADARDFVLQLAGGGGTVDFKAALNALASRGDLRVRSLPVIIGQNNQQAVLNVGSSRPYVQVTQAQAGTPPLQTVSYVDVGTRLQITPRINSDGYVNLQLMQTANSATNEIQFDAPVLSRREATTQVFLKDGQTTVIGGLTDNTRDYSRSGIPVLRSLPLIGGLFGSTHRSDVQSELYVFLTPHIISGDADIDRLRNALQQNSDELQKHPVKPIFAPPASEQRKDQ